MKNHKRPVAFLLCLLLCFSMLPSFGHAEETDPDTDVAAEENTDFEPDEAVEEAEAGNSDPEEQESRNLADESGGEGLTGTSGDLNNSNAANDADDVSPKPEETTETGKTSETHDIPVTEESPAAEDSAAEAPEQADPEESASDDSGEEIKPEEKSAPEAVQVQETEETELPQPAEVQPEGETEENYARQEAASAEENQISPADSEGDSESDEPGEHTAEPEPTQAPAVTEEETVPEAAEPEEEKNREEEQKRERDPRETGATAQDKKGETEESGKAAIPVIFLITPAEASITVWSLEETGAQTEIPAEAPNSYLLMPGDYCYTAACEGYEPQAETALRISEDMVRAEISVTLNEKEPELKPLDTEEHTGALELIADNDALMEGFIAEALYGDVVPDGMGPGLARKNFGASLSGNDVRMYKALKTRITEVANGKRTSTAFEIPASTVLGKTTTTLAAWNNGALDVDMDRVTGALMYDCPYEQYWMMAGAYSWNKNGSPIQSGSTVDVSNITFRVSFYVAKPYAPSGQGGGTTVSTAAATQVKKAVSNAKNIVSQAAGLADTEKLRYYGNRICALVDYNYAALNNMTVNGSWNNNPWELIWTFDGDSSTNVVCEGYAKSFQYLCDLTAFDRNIACYCLEGPWRDLTYGGGGGHMWNAVTMDNGVNYLVDLTHSDDGSGMSENVFLLKADSGNPADGYYFTLKDGRKAFYGYDQQCFERSTEAARTITLNREYLASPLLKSAANITGGIKVTWEKVPEATQYIVYRKTGSESWKKLGTSASTSYTDTTPIAGIKYVYTVKAQKGSTVSGYDKTGKTVTCLNAAPVLVKAENISGGIKVTWKKGTGAAKYRVFRKGPEDSSWVKQGDVTGVSYTDKNVVTGNRYTYTVRGMNSDGTVISLYDKTGVSTVCTSGKQLTKPAISAVSSARAGVKLTWDKVAQAVKYRVFRKGPGETSWTRMGDTANLNYTDKTAASGKKYSYAVRCITSDGKIYTSPLSAAATITFIAPPVISSITNITGGVKLQWKKIAGAEKYRIYRRTDSGSWTRMGDTTALSFTDKTVVIHTAYTYRVRCVSADGKSVVSSYSSTDGTITSTTGKQLAKPVISAVSNVNGGIKVTWGSVAEAEKYRVYRKGPADTSWVKLGDTTALSWKNTGVTSGESYTYAVRCLTADGKKATSPLSAGKAITYVAAPTLSSVSGTVGNVTLKWTKSAGAARYRVLYKTSASAGWSKLVDTTATSYTHKKGLNGYYYTVRCLNSSGSYCSGYNSTGKMFADGPAVTISSVKNYRNGYSEDWGDGYGVSYSEAIYASLSFTESVSLSAYEMTGKLEYRGSGGWQEVQYFGNVYGYSGKSGYYVAELSSYGTAPKGSWRLTVSLTKDGSVISTASTTTTW